ncbi:uncharacterized protein BDV14DRAFT_186159, partial [Aspergillus stella-maris]|uniref:uncharacterized protein n=1 Tax=Aspergillus stella-maris TaxID=1810926 RepID=UPI003CCE3F7C
MPSFDPRRVQKSTNHTTKKVSGPLIGVIILAVLLLIVLLITFHLWNQRRRKLKSQSTRNHDNFIIQQRDHVRETV